MQLISALSRLGSLAFTLGFGSTIAVAGPGAQHWQAPASKTEGSRSAVAAVADCSGCSGVKTEAIVVMAPSWPNARGPLAPVQRHALRICSSCGVPALGLKPAWRNGRGPLQSVEDGNPNRGPVAVVPQETAR